MALPRVIARVRSSDGSIEAHPHNSAIFAANYSRVSERNEYAPSDASSVDLGTIPVFSSSPIFRDYTNGHKGSHFPGVDIHMPIYDFPHSLPNAQYAGTSYVSHASAIWPLRESWHPSESLPNSYNRCWSPTPVEVIQDSHLLRHKSCEELRSSTNTSPNSNLGMRDQKKKKKPRPPNAKRLEKDLKRLERRIDKNDSDNLMNEAIQSDIGNSVNLEASSTMPVQQTLGYPWTFVENDIWRYLPSELEKSKLRRTDSGHIVKSDTWNFSPVELEEHKMRRTESDNWRTYDGRDENGVEKTSEKKYEEKAERASLDERDETEVELMEKVIGEDEEETGDIKKNQLNKDEKPWHQQTLFQREGFILQKRHTEPRDMRTTKIHRDSQLYPAAVSSARSEPRPQST